MEYEIKNNKIKFITNGKSIIDKDFLFCFNFRFFILDSEGKIKYSQPDDLKIGSYYIEEVEKGIYAVSTDCGIYLLDNNFKVLKIYRCKNKTHPGIGLNFHSFIYIDINHVYLVYDELKKVSNINGCEGTLIKNHVIQEIYNDNVIWEFNTDTCTDLFFYSIRNNFIKANGDIGSIYYDYAHLNDIKIDKENPNYIWISYRNIGVVKVDKTTNSIVDYICLKKSTFDCDKLNLPVLQHSMVIDNNKLIIFDNNGNNSMPPVRKIRNNEIDYVPTNLSRISVFDIQNKSFDKCFYTKAKSISRGGVWKVNDSTFDIAYGCSPNLVTKLGVDDNYLFEAPILEEIDFSTNESLFSLKVQSPISAIHIYNVKRGK